jgi:cytochrome c oxidase subunit 3
VDAQFATSKFTENDSIPPDIALKNKRFALLLWRITNGMIFVFFIFANYLMRASQKSWPPEDAIVPNLVIPTIVSVLLLLSSLPATRALNAIRRDDRHAMTNNLWAVVVLGMIFIVGVISTMVQLPWSGPYSSIVLAMNGFHIVHAFIGLLLFGYVLRRARQGAYSKGDHWAVEGAVVFWHFVDLMWVVFFLVLYVI